MHQLERIKTKADKYACEDKRDCQKDNKDIFAQNMPFN